MIDQHFVYILKCSDGSLYTGYTINLDKRLKAHNDGKASKCTRSRRPVSYIFIETFSNKSDALKREYSIKQLSRKQKLVLISKNGMEDK